MEVDEGKYTIETFAKKYGLTRQSAINLLSRLKKKSLVTTTGGGRQKRIYTISKVPKRETNGLFSIINKYSPEKINPWFEHHVHGRYRVEHALVDGIKLQKENSDARLKDAMLHLFRHVSDWTLLFDLAKKEGLVREVHSSYEEARKKTRTRAMPKRYLE